MMSLDDLIERTLPAVVYVPVRVSLLKLFGKAEREVEVLGKLFPGGGRAIDIGANKGTYTMPLLEIFDRVEAFEPIPSCALLLRRYARTRPAKLTIHECALGNEPSTAQLVVPERRSLLFSTQATAYAKIDAERAGKGDAGGRAFSVSVRRLDEFAFDDVRFIKIDVEGFEREVLMGATDTVRRNRPVLLVEIEQRHHKAMTINDIVQLVRAWDYDAKFLLDGKFHDFADFHPDLHQPAVQGECAPSDTKRYVNNFFFFPR
jgi:FkbM family methyltransferase